MRKRETSFYHSHLIFFPCHFSFIDFIHSCCCLLWTVCCYYENNHQWHEQNKCKISSRQTCARSSSVLRELRIIVSYENDFVGQSIIWLWADHSQTLRAVIMTISFQLNYFCWFVVHNDGSVQCSLRCDVKHFLVNERSHSSMLSDLSEPWMLPFPVLNSN